MQKSTRKYPRSHLDYLLASARDFPLLTPEDEKHWGHLLRHGSKAEKAQAREIFINSNIRLVISTAKSYATTCKHLKLEDLVQEGIIGLIKSTRKFDSARGWRFSTYARDWIRAEIAREIGRKERQIRLPTQKFYLLRNMLIKRSEIERLTGHRLSIEEIAVELEIDPELARKLIRLSHELISLDSPPKNSEQTNGSNREVSLISFLTKEYVPPAHEISTERAQIMEKVAMIMADCLSTREEFIIRKRFAIHEPRTFSLEEIGAIFDLTRERIRQIEIKAFRKMRRHTKFRDIAEALGMGNTRIHLHQ
jgi:RNA polymerase primary sigma factor